MKIKGILVVIGFIGLFSIFLATQFYPEIPRSMLGWLALFFLGVPVWIMLETLGEWVLSAPFFRRMSRVGRILLGVPVVLILMVLAVGVFTLMHSIIEYLTVR